MSGSPHNKTTSNTRTTEQRPQVESGPVVAKASRPSDPDRSAPSPENDPTSEYNKYGCHHKTLSSCVPQRSRAFLSVRGAEDDAVSPFETRTPALFEPRTAVVFDGGTGSANVWRPNHPHERS